MKNLLFLILFPICALAGPGPTLVNVGGAKAVQNVRTIYSSTNVTTSAWVQIVSSLPGTVNSIAIFDSSGQTLELGTGTAGNQVVQFIIPPGGILAPISLAAGTTVWLKSLSATANAGENDATFFY